MGLSLGSNNVLYVNGGSNGEFAALNSSTGVPVWTVTGVNSSDSPISVYGGVLFATGSDGFVHKRARTTGAEVWSINMGGESSVTLANGVLYNDQQGSNASETSAYAMSTCEILWVGPMPASTLHPPPLVANGTLYITNAPCGNVCAYALQ